MWISQLYVTLHDRINHVALEIIFELRQPLPTNWWSSKFEVSRPCSHGDISKNTPGLTVPNFSRKCNETRYVHSKPISMYLSIRWPHPQSERASWPLNAWTRAAVNVLNEKKGKSKVCYYTKSKKVVSGNLFVCSCSCLTCVTATGLCYDWLWSYMAEFFKPYLYKYSVLEAIKQIFV